MNACERPHWLYGGRMTSMVERLRSAVDQLLEYANRSKKY